MGDFGIGETITAARSGSPFDRDVAAHRDRAGAAGRSSATGRSSQSVRRAASTSAAPARANSPVGVFAGAHRRRKNDGFRVSGGCP